MLKILPPLFLAVSLASVTLTASATESARKADDPQTFFERYTNVAQDVILQGLKLVGVRYRFGGNDEESGLDCSGFVRLVFKNSLGAQLPRTALEMSQV
ncbi:MAG: NlpC/P60 family protein, partial [Candidatus Dechloromonas phosphoritropha]